MLADAPPWTLKFLTANWDAMAEAVPPTWMPTELPKSKAARRRLDELGCGHYGCVFPTNEPGLVLKLSSDPSEAEFIREAMAIGTWPEGIVEYHAVLELPGEFRRRQIYAIWREEAGRIGNLPPCWVFSDNPDEQADCEFFNRWFATYVAASRFIFARGTRDQLTHAQQPDRVARAEVVVDAITQAERSHSAFNRMLHFGLRDEPSAMRFALALQACRAAVKVLARHGYMNEISEALKFYWDRGLLLCDLHFGNLGQVQRAGQWIWVITDPGHAVRFRPAP